MRSALLLLLSVSAMAATDPWIQVQGTCDVKVVPDRAVVTFTAENQSRDQKDAVAKTNKQINALKDSLKGLGLADFEMKSSNYNVYPVREYEKNRVVEKGFRSSLSLEVTTSDIPKMGEAIQKASSVGITNVGNLSTFLSLEKSQKEYLKCLDLAAQDAKDKATQLGKKLGFKVGDVLSLTEAPQIDGSTSFPRAMMLKGGMEARADSSQIEAGTQKFSTNIQVTFKIK